MIADLYKLDLEVKLLDIKISVFMLVMSLLFQDVPLHGYIVCS